MRGDPEFSVEDIEACTSYKDLCLLPLSFKIWPGASFMRDHAPGRIKLLWEESVNWQVEVFPWFFHFEPKIHDMEPQIVVMHYHGDSSGSTESILELATLLRRRRDEWNGIWPFLAATYSLSGQLETRQKDELLSVFDMLYLNQHHTPLFQEMVPWNIAIAMWNTFLGRGIVHGLPVDFDDLFFAFMPPYVYIRHGYIISTLSERKMEERHKNRVKWKNQILKNSSQTK